MQSNSAAKRKQSGRMSPRAIFANILPNKLSKNETPTLGDANKSNVPWKPPIKFTQSQCVSFYKNNDLIENSSIDADTLNAIKNDESVYDTGTQITEKGDDMSFETSLKPLTTNECANLSKQSGDLNSTIDYSPREFNTENHNLDLTTDTLSNEELNLNLDVTTESKHLDIDNSAFISSSSTKKISTSPTRSIDENDEPISKLDINCSLNEERNFLNCEIEGEKSKLSNFRLQSKILEIELQNKVTEVNCYMPEVQKAFDTDFSGTCSTIQCTSGENVNNFSPHNSETCINKSDLGWDTLLNNSIGGKKMAENPINNQIKNNSCKNQEESHDSSSPANLDLIDDPFDIAVSNSQFLRLEKEASFIPTKTAYTVDMNTLPNFDNNLGAVEKYSSSLVAQAEWQSNVLRNLIKEVDELNKVVVNATLILRSKGRGRAGPSSRS